jgi:hypothetical protein
MPNISMNKDAHKLAPVMLGDGSDAARRAIGAADCHPLLSWRFAPVHQAAAAGGRPREQARVYVSR